MTPRDSWLGILLGAAALVAMIFAAYLPATRAGFVWDDDFWVGKNPLLNAPDGMWRIWFSTDQPSQYFPMVYTTFRLEHGLWGLDPVGFHVTNIALHAIDALLVWFLLRRLSIPGAWAAAAVFALHPVHVESVAWVTERKNVLMMAFSLLSLGAWLEFLDRGERSPDSGPWRFYALSLLLYILALLSKSTACTLPAALLLVVWLRRIPVDWRRWLEVAPYAVLGLAMGALSVWWERHHQGTTPVVLSMGPAERLLVASRAVWFYLWKLLWPARLAFSYEKWPIDPADPLQYGWLAGLLALGFILWRWREKIGRGPIAVMAFYVATLAPTLGFIMLATFVYTFVADHYQYVASVGPIALAAAAVATASRGASARVGAELDAGAGVGAEHDSGGRARSGTLLRAWARVGTLARVAPVCLLAVFLLVLGALTWRQSGAYRDQETLWADTLRKNPGSFLAHNNLAILLASRGRNEEAIRHYRQALEISLAHPESFRDKTAFIHYNLANSLQLVPGGLEEAIDHYRQAIGILPDYALAHNNLGNALLALKRTGDAIEEYSRALELDSSSAEAHYNLSLALKAQGRPAEAMEHYRAALRIDPGLAARVPRGREGHSTPTPR